MKSEMKFVKAFPFQFVPITKTPWGGMQISKLKKLYFPEQTPLIPERIGESLEIRVGSLLLKWIEASEPLSVQVHPQNFNSILNEGECGKHEAWFVYQVQNPSPIYLGFKENFSQDEIEACLKSATPLDCLHSFLPKKNAYISIPPGCVHALGTGTFIAEPQHLIPGKDGKTLRLFDWNRLYNAKGERDSHGSPRELHFQDALSAIDWSLPRGALLEKKFVSEFQHSDYFSGNKLNPFALQTFLKEDFLDLRNFSAYEFSLITVFSGCVNIANGKDVLTLVGGESACLPILENSHYKIKLKKMFDTEPCALVFAINKNFLE